MNLFFTSPDDRLKIWKKFRNDLNGLSELGQMKLTTTFWSQCPLVRYNFDWTDPSTWRSPWEMIYEGEICRNGIAYLMEQSLLLIGGEWTYNRFKLVMLKDIKNEDQFMVVIIDDTYVLNYSHGEVIFLNDISDFCEFSETYIPTEKGHINI